MGFGRVVAHSIRASSRVDCNDCKRPQCCAPHYLLAGGDHPHMKRREFIIVCIAAAAWPLATLAQVPPKQPLVSGLEVRSAPAVAPAIAPIEVPPLPRPRPSLRGPISDNTAVLISEFRHQYQRGASRHQSSAYPHRGRNKRTPWRDWICSITM